MTGLPAQNNRVIFLFIMKNCVAMPSTGCRGRFPPQSAQSWTKTRIDTPCPSSLSLIVVIKFGSAYHFKHTYLVVSKPIVHLN